MSRRVSRFLASLSLLGMLGCLIWPFPTGDLLAGRGRVRQEDQVALALGKASREDVILRLGEPDQVVENGKVLIYRWTEVAGFLAMGGNGNAVAIPFPSHHLLRLEFDPDARLARVDFLHRGAPLPEEEPGAPASPPVPGS